MKVIAKEGYVYTRKHLGKEDRIFMETLYLGNGDSIDNYILVTKEEMNRYLWESQSV